MDRHVSVVRRLRRALVPALAWGALALGFTPCTASEPAEPDPLESFVPADFDLIGRALLGGSREVAPLLASMLELVGEERVSTWTRIALGADALLRGDRDTALAEWQHASAIAPGTPWSADADLALGLGSLMAGDRAAAVDAFRRASANAVDERGAYADVSLGRLLAEDGDHAGAEEAFRRVYDGRPLAMVADDAALGLARSLDAQGRRGEARAVLDESKQRYERRGRYMNAGPEDPSLRWDRVARLSPEEQAAALRERLGDAIERGESPIEAALSALVDRYAGRALGRVRRRMMQEAAAGAVTGVPGGGASSREAVRRTPGEAAAKAALERSAPGALAASRPAGAVVVVLAMLVVAALVLRRALPAVTRRARERGRVRPTISRGPRRTATRCSPQSTP
ncbi:MAG: hypothetical protein AB1689_17900 [Thermodesulfobacteriota bacterium]